MENNLILPALILVPFIAGFICWLVDKFDQHLPRWIALIGMLITFGLGIALWQTGTYSYELGGKVPTWAAEFQLPWIQSLGISIHLAVDGLSLLMVLLTALLGVLAVGCSWGEIQKNVGFFHLNLLWSLGGVIGVFLAFDDVMLTVRLTPVLFFQIALALVNYLKLVAEQSQFSFVLRSTVLLLFFAIVDMTEIFEKQDPPRSQR